MVAITLFILGVAPPLGLLRKKLGYSASALGSVAMIYTGIELHTLGVVTIFYIAAGLAWLFSSIYSMSYDHYTWLAPLFSLSVFGMAIALTASNFLAFLTGYEVMTIPAYVAVGLHRKTDYPAFLFMAFSELSTLLVFAGFLYSYTLTWSFSFQPLAAAWPALLCSLGFMIKMGILPFMVAEWLPIAHGNAPANMSSLMSASMTLIAAYGLVKMILLSPGSTAFGYFLMGIGAFSVFFGALYAYVSGHNKALLGFSTIENSGAFLTLVGVFLTAPTHLLSMFALISAAVYILAHTLSKTGLFLLAGMTESDPSSHSEKAVGSLSLSGAIVLTASMSGLLPTVGGVATWALLQSLFMEAYVLHSSLAVFPIVAGSVVAMGEGFAMSTMLKFVLFSGVFRKGGLRGVTRSVTVLAVGLTVLAAGSLIYLAYAPFLVSNTLGVYGIIASKFAGEPFGGVSPLYTLLLPLILAVLVFAFTGKPKTRRSEVWNGGTAIDDRYTPFAYSTNVRLMLGKVLFTRVRNDAVEVSNASWLILYRLSTLFAILSKTLSRTYMNSRLGWYVVYMVAALIVVTLVVMI